MLFLTVWAALAASAAGGASTLTTIALIAMTKKTAITAGAALLLVGAGAVAYINRDSEKPAENTTAATAPGKSSTGSSGSLAPVTTQSKNEGTSPDGHPHGQPPCDRR